MCNLISGPTGCFSEGNGNEVAKGQDNRHNSSEMREQPTISGQLRDMIANAPNSRRQICLATGIAESILSRFMSGKRGLDLTTIDKLGKYFGLELRPVKRPGKGK